MTARTLRRFLSALVAIVRKWPDPHEAPLGYVTRPGVPYTPKDGRWSR